VKRDTYRLLERKAERKGLLRRQIRSLINNIKIDAGERIWGDVNWIGLAKYRDYWRALVHGVMKLRVP
jgi:hypothetical protein